MDGWTGIDGPRTTASAAASSLAHLRLLAALGETGALGRAAARVGPHPARRLAPPGRGRAARGPARSTQRAGRGLALTPGGRGPRRAAPPAPWPRWRRAEREMAEIAARRWPATCAWARHRPRARPRAAGAARARGSRCPASPARSRSAPSDQIADLLLAGRLDFALARLPEGRDPAPLRPRAPGRGAGERSSSGAGHAAGRRGREIAPARPPRLRLGPARARGRSCAARSSSGLAALGLPAAAGAALDLVLPADPGRARASPTRIAPLADGGRAALRSGPRRASRCSTPRPRHRGADLRAADAARRPPHARGGAAARPRAGQPALRPAPSRAPAPARPGASGGRCRSRSRRSG